MKVLFQLWSLLPTRILAFAGMLGVACSAHAAVNAAQVEYDPVLKPLEGVIPFQRSYTLSIISPYNLPAGSVTTTLAASVNAKPTGVTDATALSYLTFSPSTLTFTAPSQTLTTTVTLNVPSGAVPGSYGYQIYCNGWPTTVPIFNLGAALNMTVSIAPLATPPTVVIQTPSNGQVFTIPASASTASIPFSFAGASDSLYPITSVDADRDGNPIQLKNPISGLNTGSVSATAKNDLVLPPGWYYVTARATNIVGTATTKHLFIVQKEGAPPPATAPLQGCVFFDANFDGLWNSQDPLTPVSTPSAGDEPGLGGVSVAILNAVNQVVTTTITDAMGLYSVSLPMGSYHIVIGAVPGLAATTPNAIEQDVTISTAAGATALPAGYGLKFSSIRTMKANGYTIGYWKTNLDKSIDMQSKGVQQRNDVMPVYTTMIGTFALSPLNVASMIEASGILGDSNPDPVALLKKQLMASEYNYFNAGYIGGNDALTKCFVYWGEYIANNASSYSSSYILFAKDCFDAYNNSHGGYVALPPEP